MAERIGKMNASGGGRPWLGSRHRDMTCRRWPPQEPMPRRTLAASARADRAR